MNPLNSLCLAEFEKYKKNFSFIFFLMNGSLGIISLKKQVQWELMRFKKHHISLIILNMKESLKTQLHVGQLFTFEPTGSVTKMHWFSISQE